MPLFFLTSLFIRIDSDALVTQELVDRLSASPNISYKCKLYPKFANLTISNAKRFLSPVRSPPQNHGSAIPVGADENRYSNGLNFTFAGIWQSDITETDAKTYLVPVYDVTNLCSSWAPAITSAVSISVGRWANRFMNFSLQFVIDCDLLGDACIDRSTMDAFSLFIQAKVPESSRWDDPGSSLSPRTSNLQAPVSTLTKDICLNPIGCYPGHTGCTRSYVLTGTCGTDSDDTQCPIYFLYNWRWIKSHLYEVGAVTSSIIVKQSLFTYNEGVYSIEGDNSEILGMLDVTILGWGESNVSINPTQTKNRWWWVTPHLGCDFGIPYETIESSDSAYSTDSMPQRYVSGGENCAAGFMKFNRRFDDSMIESFAIGHVPYNFIPGEWPPEQASQ